MEGLSTAGNIQGGPADALLAILHSKSIGPALKWVDHFVFFRAPTYCDTDAAGMVSYSYSYDLASVMKIMDPLSIPWHPIEVKGQDFGLLVSYVGFMWNLELHTVSLSPKKRTKYLEKVHSAHHTLNALSRKHCKSILRTSSTYRSSTGTAAPGCPHSHHSSLSSQMTLPRTMLPGPLWIAYDGGKRCCLTLYAPAPSSCASGLTLTYGSTHLPAGALALPLAIDGSHGPSRLDGK